MSQKAEINFAGQSHSIKITWKEAYYVLQEKFNLNVMDISSEGNQGIVVVFSRLLQERQLAIDLFCHYITKGSPVELFGIDDFTPEKLREFTEAFVVAIVNFTDIQYQDLVSKTWKEMKRVMKKEMEKSLMQLSSEQPSQ